MNRKIFQSITLYLIFLILALANYGFAVEARVNSSVFKKQDRDIAVQVKKAFDEVRKNRIETPNLDKLKSLGEEIIPYLQPYLNDVNSDVRIEAINVALEIGGNKSLNLIGLALQNSRQSLQIRSSEMLYEHFSGCRKFYRFKDSLPEKVINSCKGFSATDIGANTQIEKGLKNIIKSGRESVSTIFLLSNFSDEESVVILKGFAAKSDCRTNKNFSFRNIKLSIASKIALAKKDDSENIKCLSEIVENSDTEHLKFFLTHLNEIESSNLLLLLTKSFDIKDSIEAAQNSEEVVKKLKLPKGSFIDFHPPRRLCDLAVTAFVERLNLKVDIKTNSTNFFKHQIDQVRELTKQALSNNQK